MSEKISMAKGIIFSLLGIFLTYGTIVLHFRYIFTYLGVIVIGFGVCSMFISFLRSETYHSLVFNKGRFQGSLGGSTHMNGSSHRKDSSHREGNILDRSLRTNEEDPSSSESLFKPKSQSETKKKNKFPIFSGSKSIKELKFSNSKSYISNNSKTKSRKPKSEEKGSNPFVFTPNYERPSSITRKPVKKTSNSSKARKLGKIKPTIPINQLSKTLGLEKKEDEDLIKLRRMLRDDNFKNDPNLNDPIISNSASVDTLNHPTPKNHILNGPTPKNAMIDNNSVNKELLKNDRLINKEILDDIIKDDLKHENNDQNNFINGLDEVYIICGDKSLKFNEALEKLSKEARKEIAIEIPSLKYLSNKFLLTLNYLNSRIVIEKFDVKDMSYSFMVSSLLNNNNISIKTVDSIDSINVIVDDDHALLLSEPVDSGMGVGAVFSEKREVDSIKDAFDLLWKVSEEL